MNRKHWEDEYFKDGYKNKRKPKKSKNKRKSYKKPKKQSDYRKKSRNKW
tara:strand:- start:256 stop:402 length:147 start_codon:yes stop_codon:yes gene_type:complete